MAEKLLNKEQVDAVVEFSQALYSYGKYGYWSPFLSNQYLQNLNDGGKAPTSQSIRKALQSYKDGAKDIHGYMEFMQTFDMIFARTVKSYVNALSFDLQVIPTNAYIKADYDSKEYQEDKQRVYNFLNKFDYKNEFRKVVEQLILHEVYFVWFRKSKWGNKDKMKLALQVMPQDRCLLTGYWEKGLLYDFDMSYFLQAGTDIDGYDPVFKKYYQRVFGENQSIQDYRPTNPLVDRKGTYAMWTQTSPADGAWAFKFTPSNFTTIPFLSPILKNAITNDEIEQLQYNKDIAEAYAILAGEIDTFDTAKSGTQADQMVFKPSTLGGFMSKAKQGLGSTVKLAALPLKNIKWNQFEDSNPKMYEEQLATSAAVSSGVSRIVYSTDRMSNAEVEASLNELYQTVKPLYAQFGNFLDFYVNQLTKKYKFRFVFDGSTYGFERKARVDNLIKIADKGIVLAPSAWASAMGYEPQLFEASLIESKNSGWTENLQLLLNINTTAQDGSGDMGRPRTEDPTDSTERNYDQ